MKLFAIAALLIAISMLACPEQSEPPTGARPAGTLPDCPADLNNMPIGICVDQTDGKIKIRDAAGVRDL